MRQTDFCIGQVGTSIKRKSRMLTNSMILNMDVAILYHVHRKLKKRKMDLRKLLQRKRHVKGVTFNLNAFSENQSLTDFRFPKSDVQKVAVVQFGARMFDWTTLVSSEFLLCETRVTSYVR